MKRRRYLRVLLGVLVVLVALFVLAVLFVPPLDVNKRQRMMQVRAVVALRNINNLQLRYAAARRSEGYSCQLKDLDSMKMPSDDFDSTFLVNGERAGYKFVFVACAPDGDGRVRHYQVAATPMNPVDSGFRFLTFCTDDSGVIRRSSSESIADCLARGERL